MNIQVEILHATPYGILFRSVDLIWLACSNDPAERFCDRCKAFGRIAGNRICPDCNGKGLICG